jgi:hypothetical protein
MVEMNTDRIQVELCMSKKDGDPGLRRITSFDHPLELQATFYA